MKVSFLIPAHNEKPSIGPLVKKILGAVPQIHEVIVVDDGSTDETAAAARDAGAKVVSLHPNAGKGAAFTAGLRVVSGDVVVVMDADGQDDPADAPALIDAIERGNDFVNGSRFIGEIEKGAISSLHLAGNKFMTWLVNLLFSAGITDSQAGFRAFRTDRIAGWRLRARSYELETEMLLRALRHRLRITEVPVRRFRREHGRSGFKTFRNGFRILFFILRERFAG